ncbi:hypothetical protein P167DRAFT_577490 [Morchella conica CCBAS932]|uniref:DNA-directed RNA polymerase M/15kDa subunit domain-containing protein n=1 Tax=Morchella conica CCBAS932 TaxID=1392247 RepID=A0A3N4KF78_9PEZI|nr:hypothetical protein P167DRAFT_577490 [Morchella conica CCBAS932]
MGSPMNFNWTPSPSPPPSSRAEVVQKKQPAISFSFCRECNLQYPYHCKITLTLQYKCRSCNVSEPAKGNCIFRQTYNKPIAAEFNSDIVEDPTMPRTEKLCTHCGEDQAVLFQRHDKDSGTTMASSIDFS